MIEPINSYIAVLDACTLAPMPLCHTLLNLAEEPALYVPKWSERILEEVASSLRKFGRTEAQISRRLKAMRDSFEDAAVSGYEDLIPAMTNHEKDRHVLAVAVRAGAHVIVTQNEKHFRQESLDPYGICKATPDKFLCDQFHLEPSITLDAIDRQASDIRSSRGSVLEKLKIDAPRFVDMVVKSGF